MILVLHPRGYPPNHCRDHFESAFSIANSFVHTKWFLMVRIVSAAIFVQPLRSDLFQLRQDFLLF